MEAGRPGALKQAILAARVLNLLPDVVHHILGLLGNVVRRVLDLHADIVCYSLVFSATL